MAFVSITEFSKKMVDGGDAKIYLYPNSYNVIGSASFKAKYSLSRNIEVDIDTRVIRMKFDNSMKKESYLRIKPLFDCLGIKQDAGIIRLSVTERDGWLYCEPVKEFKK